MSEIPFDPAEFTESVGFMIDGNHIVWRPDNDGIMYPISGPRSKEFADTVTEFIYEVSDLNNIQVAPEGPNLPADPKFLNLYTVTWAINVLFSEMGIEYLGGKHPTMSDLGLDQASYFDKYGNPLVR
jgi:hypothetical protein